MNVLVVDDDEMVRYVLTEKLSEVGFSTTSVGDGLKAIELFSEANFDAVLLDLKMPGLDGIETLKELRKHDPGIPVIMVTAFGDIATAVEAIKLGAYDFVEKPPQISRIVVTLRRAIEKASLERKIRELGKSVEESEALKQAYHKLQELDQAKTAFLTSVSHELRTPLTSIVGYAEISKKNLTKLIPSVEDDPKVCRKLRQLEENLGLLVSESERLTVLIESILDQTAMAAGTAEWRWELLSIKDVIEGATRPFYDVFKNKDIDFSVEIEAALPLVRGDRQRLAQVVTQMLSNASMFTKDGCVVCSAVSAGNDIVLSVTDTGRGIDPSRHGLIFEEFSQIGDILIDKPKGIGLGLPICRLIVESHGGTISVKSEPGKGSTFTIMIPVEEEHRA